MFAIGLTHRNVAEGKARRASGQPQAARHSNASEGVKKLKIPKIHFRKSLIRNKACTGSSEFFQFFHSFSVKAGRARHPVRAVVPSHQSARTE